MNKNRKYNSKIVDEILHHAPLKQRLNVLIEIWLQTHLIDIAVIPDGYWSDEKEKEYGVLFRKPSKKLTKWIMKEIKDWEKDGKPK
jgi:hypothetical protein